MSNLVALFQSNAFYILPSWGYVLLYILDLMVFVFGLRLIARRTFPFSAYTLGFCLLAFPDIILYPTDRSRINIYATGSFFYDRYMVVIDHAFFVSSVGFWIFVATIRLTKRHRAIKIERAYSVIKLAIFSDTFAVVLCSLQVFLFMILFAEGVNLTSARTSGFQDTSIRPFVVASTYLVTFSLTIFFAKCFFRLSVKNVGYVILSVAFAATLGVRSAIFDPFLYFIFYYAWWYRDKNIIKYVISGIAILVIIHLADLFRSDVSLSGGLGLVGFISSVFYGNSFSDLRDFAWIISGWDGGLLWGKTYVAGILGFVPSFLFPLREQWNLGPITLQLSDVYIIDPNHEHPGLRGTFVAEPFINFGYLGVLAIAVLLGRAFLFDSTGIKDAVIRRDKADFISRIVRYEFFISIVGAFYNTSGFSYIYFILIMFFFVGILRRVR